MKTFSVLLFAATFVVATSSSSIRGSLSDDEDQQPERRLRIEESTCTLTKTCTSYEPDEDHPRGYSKDTWSCGLSDEDAKLLGTESLEIDEESPEVQAALATAISTQSTLTMSEAIVDGDTERTMMHVPKNARIEVNPIDPIDTRMAAKNAGKMGKPSTTGTLKALVIRLTDNKNRSPASVAKLEDDVFKDSVSLSTQMSACSYGKLNIQPFKGKTPRGVNVKNGVVDVKLDYDITTTYEGDKYRAHQKVKEVLGDIDDANYGINLVLFCYPKGSQNNWGASAVVGGRYSDYNEEHCGSSMTLLHEIGHNLGLSHSGEWQDGVFKEYGDTSGVMGAGSRADDEKICFNPAKSFQLRWYDDKVQAIDPLDGLRQREFVLNGVSDYKKNPNALVALRLVQLSPGLTDYYIGFNRAEGIHEKSREDFDTVTIVKKLYNGPHSAGQSDKVAALKPGEWMEIKNFDGRKDVLVAFTGLKNGDARIIVSDNMNDRPALPTNHCKKFTVEVNSGNHPQDIHWHVVDRDDWGRGVAYSPEITKKQHKYRKDICLPMGSQPKTYKFEVFDAYGDGIVGGNYKVFDGNQEIVSHSKGKFKHQVHSIQVPRDPNPLPPTKAPTPYPTQTPTAAPPCQTHTIEFKTDRWPGDNKWKLYQKFEFSGEPPILEKEVTKFNDKETLYKTEVCLVPGKTYELKVEDSHFDGICCGQGEGYYRVLDDCGKVLADSEKEDVNFKNSYAKFKGSHCGVPTGQPTKAPTPGNPRPITKPPTSQPCKNKKKKKLKIQGQKGRKKCDHWAQLGKCDAIVKKNKPVWFFCKKACGKC